MFEIKKNQNVKLFFAITYQKNECFDKSINFLSKKFGAIDFVSDEFNFSNFTHYYDDEIGERLKKKIVSFKKLISPENIYLIKHFSNKAEYLFANKNSNDLKYKVKRTVNLDPGYLTTAKVILLTTKNNAHRIYLKRGIYAEITLTYRKKTFSKNSWTYMDYQSKLLIDFFNNLRKCYAEQIKEKSN